MRILDHKYGKFNQGMLEKRRNQRRYLKKQIILKILMTKVMNGEMGQIWTNSYLVGENFNVPVLTVRQEAQPKSDNESNLTTKFFPMCIKGEHRPQGPTWKPLAVNHGKSHINMHQVLFWYRFDSILFCESP